MHLGLTLKTSGYSFNYYLHVSRTMLQQTIAICVWNWSLKALDKHVKALRHDGKILEDKITHHITDKTFPIFTLICKLKEML